MIKVEQKPILSAQRKESKCALWWALLLFLLLLVVGVLAGYRYYRNFYSHVTPEELSHAVQHTSFETQLRGTHSFKLELYRQANAKNQPLVLFTSGDGGWSPFCADVAAQIAATGRVVVGFDAKTYLTTFAESQKPVTPEELAQDYQTLMAAARALPGVNSSAPMTLSGWSLGAGFSVLAASNEALKSQIERVVLISLPELNELAWKPTDALIYITHGTPHEKVFNSGDYLARLAPVAVFMLNATDDDTSPIADAQKLFSRASEPKQLQAVRASGHHFEGGEAEFYSALKNSLTFTARH